MTGIIAPKFEFKLFGWGAGFEQTRRAMRDVDMEMPASWNATALTYQLFKTVLPT